MAMLNNQMVPRITQVSPNCAGYWFVRSTALLPNLRCLVGKTPHPRFTAWSVPNWGRHEIRSLLHQQIPIYPLVN